MNHQTADMTTCIEDCLRCHQSCLGMAMNHCLEAGGNHLEPVHFRLMIACAEICQATANVMLTGSEIHKRLCKVCAEVCEQCAASCEQVGDMQECVDACRRCAEICQKVAS